MSGTFNRTAARKSGRWSDAHVSMGLNATACDEMAPGSSVEAIPRACIGKAHALQWDEDSDGLNTAGYGGLSASAEDMSKFLKNLLVSSDIQDDGDHAFPAAVVDLTSRPRVVSSPAGEYEQLGASMYGMGAVVQEYRGHTTVFHVGGAPGHSSLIARVPAAGVAVAILANHATYGAIANPFVWYKLLDTLLGLSPIEWDKRLVDAVRGYVGALSPNTSGTTGTPPSTPWHDIPGTYSDPQGYGDLNLERDDGSLLTSDERQVVKTAGGNLAQPVFAADLDAAAANRIIFTHSDKDIFLATILFNSPEVYGNGTVVSFLGAMPIVITPSGIAAFGLWWRGRPDIVNPEPPVAGGVEEIKKTAEVWFAKV